MIKTIITAFIAFVATNVDDLFILMLFYGNKKVRNRDIIPGQVLGIIILLATSIALSFTKYIFDQRYIGFMGLFPIYLGLKQVVGLFKKQRDNDDVPAEADATSGILAIAGITIANGGDNVGVYAPLVTLMNGIQLVILTVVFVLMSFGWCMMARYLVGHPLLAGTFGKYSHVIMPFILLLLGVFILIASDTFSLFGLPHTIK